MSTITAIVGDQLALAGITPKVGEVLDLDVDGDIGILANGAEGITVLDLSDFHQPVKIVNHFDHDYESFHVDSDYLLMTNYNEMRLCQITGAGLVFVLPVDTVRGIGTGLN